MDRRALFRRGVLTVLAAAGDIAIVGEAPDVDTAVGLARTTDPDIVLLATDLPDSTGPEACATLRRAFPRARVVVVSAHDDPTSLAGVVRAGASGYLLEDCSTDELLEAVRVVSGGGSLLSPAMAGRLLDEFTTLVRRSDAEDVAPLTRRELEVLALVAEGLGNRAIAERLFISENTVKNHLRRIHEKLQVHTRMEAVVRAVRDGLLEIA